MATMTPGRPARAIRGTSQGAAPARRAVIDPCPISGPEAASSGEAEPERYRVPFGKSGVQLIRGYLIAAAVVLVVTVFLPMLLSVVRNF